MYGVGNTLFIIKDGQKNTLIRHVKGAFHISADFDSIILTGTDSLIAKLERLNLNCRFKKKKIRLWM